MSIASLLVLLTLATIACVEARQGAPENRPVRPGDAIPYEGPERPADTEWLFRSLDGQEPAEGSDIELFHDREEINVEGGCMGFYLVNELEPDRLRVVRPGLQVGRLECGRPEAVQRQAEEILDLMRHLARVRATEDRMELTDESGRTAVFARPPPAEVDPSLVETEWFLVSLEGREPLEGGSRLTLEITRDGIGGFSGCNSFGGAVDRMAGGEIVYAKGHSEGFDSTLIGCGPKSKLRQENAYQDAVSGAEGYRLDGGRLELVDGQGRTTAVFEEKVRWSSDPEDLVGTRWKVRSIDGERPAEGSVPTVHFRTEKEISWYDGCQNFEGEYSATGNDLAVPNVGVSDRDCMKPEAYQKRSGPCVVRCFGPEGDYRLREGFLEIRSETGESTTILEPVDSAEEPAQKGTPWELRAFVEDDEQTSVRGTEITLTFDRGTLRETGTVFGSTGCNEYRAAYEYPAAHNTYERVFFDDPVTTRRACAGPRYLTEQEDRFLSVLGDLASYPSISRDGRLTLETRDGRGLIFAAPERTTDRGTT